MCAYARMQWAFKFFSIFPFYLQYDETGVWIFNLNFNKKSSILWKTAKSNIYSMYSSDRIRVKCCSEIKSHSRFDMSGNKIFYRNFDAFSIDKFWLKIPL